MLKPQKKSSAIRKSSQTKRTSSTRKKAKKPKVKLAKNKVAVLCALISGICVFSLALTVIINSGEKSSAKSAEKIVETKKTEPEKKPAEMKTPNDTTKNSTSSHKPLNQIDSQTTISKTEKKTSSEIKKQTAEQKKHTEKKSETSVTKTTIPEARQIQKNQHTDTAPQKSSAQKTNSPTQIASAVSPSQTEQIQQNIPKNRFDIPPASNNATIVIIIDDAGRSAENTKQYASLPFPITIAVLPKLPQTKACADVIRASGKEMILHQPMQSMNLNLDPGPGKITGDMSGFEIAEIIKENLRELGSGVKGINNHEGSLITSNEIKIGTVLDVCAEMGVYFLDSRTTAATKAPQAALERDMHIFEKAGPYLDNDIDRAKMLERMRETLAYANRHGSAIVIGHVDKSVKILPDLLREMYPEMKAAGYRFATPSTLR